jgi:hypothetical protein
MSDFVVDQDEDPLQPPYEKLVAVRVRFTPESSPDPVKAQPVSPASTREKGKAKRRKNRPSQGDTFLLSYLAPNHPDVAKAAATTPIHGESGSEESGDSDASMDDIDTIVAKKMEKDEHDEKLRLEQLEHEKRFVEAQEKKAKEEEEERKAREEVARQARNREEEMSRRTETEKNARRMAAAALGMSPQPPHPPSPASQGSSGYVEVVLPEEKPNLPPIKGLGFKIPDYDRSTRNNIKAEPLQSPLEVRRMSVSNAQQDDSLVTSPLAGYMKQSDSIGHRLPALQSPGSPDGAASPQNQKLPGFAQLDEIATKANETISRRYSISAPSPLSSYPSGPVRSPFNQTSPSIYSDTSPRQALSPGSGISMAFGLTRRPSQASEYPPPLASASTTDSSYASTDGYSPSTQPTPQSETHRMSIDGTGPPILPPPVPSMQPLTIHTIPAHGSGGFKCDYSGCTAPPFQTQYLLK